MEVGQQFCASLKLFYGDSEHAGPATRMLAACIKNVVTEAEQGQAV